MKKLFILLILSIPSLCYGAHPVNDSGAVRGVVRDEAGQPLDFASITLMSMTDSLIYSSAVSGSDGAFSVACPSDRALLRVEYIGCKRVEMECSRGGRYEIRMLPDTVSFGEVLVTGHKRIIKSAPDGMSVDVKGTVLEKLGTADDILKSLPFVRKDDDKYKVDGKGEALIYLNGRKLQDLNELDQLSSEDIKRVEVIENPGARYDASANAVIKIVTARKEGEGFGFDARSSFYASEMPDFTEQVNFNYRHKGLDIFGMVSLKDIKGYYKCDTETEVSGDSLWLRNGNDYYKWHYTMLNFRLGANYTTGNSSLGFLYSAGKPIHEKYSYNGFTESYCDGVFEDRLTTDFHRKENNTWRHDASAYYSGKAGSLTIDFNADFFHSGNNIISDYTENSLNTPLREMTSNSKMSNNLFSARLDFSYPLLGGKLSFGSEFSSMKRDEDNLGGISEIPVSHFSLRERSLSAYMEYSRNIKLCDIKLGLRYENQDKKYRSNGELLEDQSGNSSWFAPNVSLYRKAGKFSSSVSYTTNLYRPSYKSLSSIVSYKNRYTWTTGTPSLVPRSQHTIGLSLSYDVFNLGVHYNIVNDDIINWGYVVPQTGGVVMEYPTQLDKTKFIYARISASPRFGIFTTFLGASIQRMWANLPKTTNPINLDSPIICLDIKCTAAISPTFTADLLVNYMSRGDDKNETNLSDDAWDVQVSAIKSFLSDRLSLKLAFYDIFRRRTKDTRAYYDNVTTSNLNFRLKTRQVELTIRYKFNSAPSKYKGKGAGSNEKQRL